MGTLGLAGFAAGEQGRNHKLVGGLVIPVDIEQAAAEFDRTVQSSLLHFLLR